MKSNRSSWFQVNQNPNRATIEIGKKKNPSLISPEEIEKEVINGTQIIVLVAREVAKETQETILPVVTPVITKFTDVFPMDLPD